LAVAGATGLQLRANVEGAFARAFSASPQPLLVWRSARQLFWRYEAWGLDQDEGIDQTWEVP